MEYSTMQMTTLEKSQKSSSTIEDIVNGSKTTNGGLSEYICDKYNWRIILLKKATMDHEGFCTVVLYPGDHLHAM